MKFRLAFLAITAAISAVSLASPVGYTFSTNGSGSFNGVSFSGALVTINASGDTADILGSSPFMSLPVTATVQVSGLGGGTFTGPISVFINQNGGSSAVGVQITSLLDILDVQSGSLNAYDLTAPFGPVDGGALYNPGASFATTGGDFVLDSAFEAKFVAQAVPEPTTMAALGLGALGILKRRKKA